MRACVHACVCVWWSGSKDKLFSPPLWCSLVALEWGRMHWRVLRVMSRSRLSACLLIMERYSRKWITTVRQHLGTDWQLRLHHHAAWLQICKDEVKMKVKTSLMIDGIHLISRSIWDSRRATSPAESGPVWEHVPLTTLSISSNLTGWVTRLRSHVPLLTAGNKWLHQNSKRPSGELCVESQNNVVHRIVRKL